MFRLLFFYTIAAFTQANLLVGSTGVDNLRIGVQRDIDSFNPYVSVNRTGEVVAMRLFPTLFKELPSTRDGLPELAPYLVQRHEWRTDETVLHLHLKEGLQWSDGRALTSGDVVYSLQIQKDPKVAWISSEGKRNVAGWKALDARTVEVRFHKKSPFNLMHLNEGFIIPEHHFSQKPLDQWHQSDWSKDLVVFGPYRIDAYKPDQSLILKPIKPGGSPILGFAVVKDKETLYKLVSSKQLDVSWSLPTERIPDIKARLTPIIDDDMTFGHIVWNPIDPTQYAKRPPESTVDLANLLKEAPHPLFSDHRVRQAMTWAMDRRRYDQRFWYGGGDIPVGPWSVGRHQWSSQQQARGLDREKARSLLAEAGWTQKDGVLQKAGKPFSFRVICNTGSAIRESYLLSIQQDLEQLGVKMSIDLQEAGLYINKLQSRQFDAAFNVFRRGSSPDLSELFHGRAALGGYNFSSWTGADTLLDQVRNATDADQVPDLLRQLETLFSVEQPLTILYLGKRVGACSNPALKPMSNHLDPLHEVGKW